MTVVHERQHKPVAPTTTLTTIIFKDHRTNGWGMFRHLDDGTTECEKPDGTMFAGYRPEGIVRSTDGGATFRKIWHGCGQQVSSVVVSPDFPKDRTLFASTNKAVHRSVDGGETWTRAGTFPGFNKANLAISPNFAKDQALYASGPTGLWRSRDSASTWTPLEWGVKRVAT